MKTRLILGDEAKARTASILPIEIVGARPNMRGKRVVTIIPSFAERYLSTPLFADEPEYEVRGA